MSSEGPKVVAVVDDDTAVQRGIRRLLASAGFAVETFGSGGAFLRSLQSRRPDCLVLDLHMSGMNGLEVQAKLRELGEPVPVVFITGSDLPRDQQRATAAGAAAYLRKPPDGQALLQAISDAMSRANHH